MHRTLIIRREYLHFIPKYSRYEKRHKNLAAHVSPAFRVEEGDTVTVGQCRPLSKTVGQPRMTAFTILTEIRSSSTCLRLIRKEAKLSKDSPSFSAIQGQEGKVWKLLPIGVCIGIRILGNADRLCYFDESRNRIFYSSIKRVVHRHARSKSWLSNSPKR